MKNALTAVGLIFLAIALLLFPFATIWAMNTLFALAIDYTFWTWLAVCTLQLSTFGGLQATIKANK